MNLSDIGGREAPMNEVDRFICDGNISRFVDQLRRETNPARRETLKRLLIEEEDRFGAAEERLQMVERNLTDGAALIDRQARLVAELKAGGRDAGAAERMLRTFEMTQELFERCHAQISEAKDRLRR
jgi:hypothetical protein